MSKQTPEELFADLFIAVLSVNQYRIEKTWKSKEALRAAGLLDPATLSELTVDEIAIRMRGSGLNRGEFLTDLFAERLSHVARFIRNLGLQRASEILAVAEQDEIATVFTKAKGIGPVVIRNFLTLRDP